MSVVSPDDQARLEALEEDLERRFRTARTQVEIEGSMLELVHPANADDLISEADYVRDERLPYWADLWPSSRVLAAHVATLDGGGAPLLELGCGMGLVSTVAARRGFAVTATDYYEEATEFASVNAWRNGGGAITGRHVDWRAMPTDLGRFRWVVASDILYEPAHAELVAGAIDRTLASGGTAIVADPGRLAAPNFVLEIRRRGLGVRTYARIPWTDGKVNQTIDLYEIRP